MKYLNQDSVCLRSLSLVDNYTQSMSGQIGSWNSIAKELQVIQGSRCSKVHIFPDEERREYQVDIGNLDQVLIQCLLYLVSHRNHARP
jgi:hypothetical protein